MYQQVHPKSYLHPITDFEQIGFKKIDYLDVLDLLNPIRRSTDPSKKQ